MTVSAQLRRYLTGILVSIAGAYSWALLALTFYGFNVGWIGFQVFFFAGYAVLITSWFVIPTGVGLGYLLPRVVVGHSRQVAAIRGVLLGICSGIIAALLTSVMETVADYHRLRGDC
jgi:hypothetical protein